MASQISKFQIFFDRLGIVRMVFLFFFLLAGAGPSLLFVGSSFIDFYEIVYDDPHRAMITKIILGVWASIKFAFGLYCVYYYWSTAIYMISYMRSDARL